MASLLDLFQQRGQQWKQVLGEEKPMDIFKAYYTQLPVLRNSLLAQSMSPEAKGYANLERAYHNRPVSQRTQPHNQLMTDVAQQRMANMTPAMLSMSSSPKTLDDLLAKKGTTLADIQTTNRMQKGEVGQMIQEVENIAGKNENMWNGLDLKRLLEIQPLLQKMGQSSQVDFLISRMKQTLGGMQ